MDLSWQDVHWADPDGGEVIFHAVIPTMVYPRALRIRENGTVYAYLRPLLKLRYGTRKTNMNVKILV